jgi:hypothetical protein
MRCPWSFYHANWSKDSQVIWTRTVNTLRTDVEDFRHHISSMADGWRRLPSLAHLSFPDSYTALMCHRGQVTVQLWDQMFTQVLGIMTLLIVTSHKEMVWSDMSKPALIFFFTARVCTTKSTVKILAANMRCRYFLKIAEVTHFFCTRNHLYQRFVQSFVPSHVSTVATFA